ncbi:MAG: DUF3990 domain-containing protein [Tannerella sp.]|jgi:hypothetical protein|nr:DUF3990 domain-containing protein [Tannerella sp.]
MKLYHGSNCDFSTVDLSKSKDKRDFGKGFYLTTLHNQAKDWAEILCYRYGGDGIFVYEYEFAVKDGLNIKQFDGLSEGIYTAKMALRKLRYNKLNDQVSVHTERALDCLVLINKTVYGN